MTEEIDVPFAIDEEVGIIIDQLKTKKRLRLITLKIEKRTIIVDQTATRNTSVQECFSYFPDYECRYVLWDVDFSDGYISSTKLYLFTWCPNLAPMNHKATYFAQRQLSLNNVVQGALQEYCSTIEVVKKIIKFKAETEEEEEVDDWMDV